MTKLFDFLREVNVELAKVVWPSWAQTLRLTIMVVIVTVVVGFFLGGIDFVLTKLTDFLLQGR